MSLVGQGVAGLGLLELGHRAQISGHDLRHRRGLLALQELERPDPLADVARGVVDDAVRFQGPGVDPEEGEPPGVGIGEGLEDEGR
jgi:hypothetical protein